MTGRDYARALREGWIIIVVCTLLGTAVGATVAFARPPSYEATATLAVSTCVAVENSNVCDPVGGMSFAVQRARIYAATIDNLPVQRRALELTDATSDRRELREHVTVTQLSDSPIISVTANWSTATASAQVANAVAQALVEYARESIDNFESELATVQFAVVSEANAPAQPVMPPWNAIPTAALLGLVLGLGLALWRYLTNDRVRYADRIETTTELRLLTELRVAEIAHGSDKVRLLKTVLSSRATRVNASRVALAIPHEHGPATELTMLLADDGAHETGVAAGTIKDVPSLREATPRVQPTLADITTPEGLSLITSADAVVVVVIIGMTTEAQLESAIRAVSLVEAPVLGAVAIKP